MLNYIIIKAKSDPRWWTAVCSFEQGMLFADSDLDANNCDDIEMNGSHLNL